MKKAIVLASSRGIGKSIADSLKKLTIEVVTTIRERKEEKEC